MIIKQINISDIDEIESLTKICFDKFKLEDNGFIYCADSLKKKYEDMINMDLFFKKKVVDENGRIVGFIWAIEGDTLYNIRQKQISEIGMQSHPDLNTLSQSKIIKMLIKSLEDYANENDISIISISISPKFDIGKHLEKKKYKLCDKIYVKERKER